MLDPNRGLDLSKPDVITPEEAEAFKKAYSSVQEQPHIGLNFWLENRPDYLKRYRNYAQMMAPNLEVDPRTNSFPDIAIYALTGFSRGIRYWVRGMQLRGMSKSQCLEALGIAFLHVGPRGSETIAEALTDYSWIEPDKPAAFPDGWAPDAAAFASGLNFGVPQIQPGELEKVTQWYQRTLGEIPRYVTLLGKYNPNLLKAYRSRFETCLRELPKQLMPTTLLAFNMIRSNSEGIRENMLMARAFGVNRDMIARVISRGTLYGGVEGAGLVDAVAGELLDDWDQWQEARTGRQTS